MSTKCQSAEFREKEALAMSTKRQSAEFREEALAKRKSKSIKDREQRKQRDTLSKKRYILY